MLRPKKHISRKKIKEDRFVTLSFQVAGWIRAHRTPLMAAGIGVIVLIFAVAGLYSSRRAAEEQASLLALEGGYELSAGNLETAQRVLQEAVNRYPRTRSAGRASYMLAQVYFQMRDIDRAQELYEQYLKRHARDNLTRAGAQAGLGACHEQREDWTEAARAYETAARIINNPGMEASYLLRAARAWRLGGDTTRSVMLYDRLIQEHPFTAEADRASVEKAMLTFAAERP